jgi:hypothetical protein
MREVKDRGTVQNLDIYTYIHTWHQQNLEEVSKRTKVGRKQKPPPHTLTAELRAQEGERPLSHPKNFFGTVVEDR